MNIKIQNLLPNDTCPNGGIEINVGRDLKLQVCNAAGGENLAGARGGGARGAHGGGGFVHGDGGARGMHGGGGGGRIEDRGRIENRERFNEFRPTERGRFFEFDRDRDFRSYPIVQCRLNSDCLPGQVCDAYGQCVQSFYYA